MRARVERARTDEGTRAASMRVRVFCEMGNDHWLLRSYAPLPETAARHRLSGTPCLTAPAR